MASDAPQWTNSKINWRSRIVKFGKIRADQITPHPSNPRTHPIEQRQAVQASFDVLGQIAPIIININNGYLVDGAERSWLALSQGDGTEIDAIWIDLSEEEHNLALASFDWITQMAAYDRQALDELLQAIGSVDDNAVLNVLLNDLANQQGLYDFHLPSPGDLLNEHGDYNPDTFTVKITFDISREVHGRFQVLKKEHAITDDSKMFEMMLDGL